ncbi:hypothetical protein N6H14_13220 [Paenibacillus sp. CC-CFT747]|nr:hypothetical protein N6H14_13220 [Paenibacillus sp. CC-CFT747]
MDRVKEVRTIRKAYGFLLVIALAVLVLNKTNPSSSDYHEYLNEAHGILCPLPNDSCFHQTKDAYSQGIKDFGLFMVAKTTIFDEGTNYIRVAGLLGHFFVIEKKLKRP